MANWLLEHNIRLKNYCDKTFTNGGAVIFAAARADTSVSCAFVLIGTGGMDISKFRGPVAALSLFFYVGFVFLYVSGVRRLRASKRFRVETGG